MSPLLRFLHFSTSLIAVCNGYPNLSPLPQTGPRPSVENIKRDSSQDTIVGWYTTASGAAWEINTCGDGSVWSTSGQYGACAPQTGQSLYTVCSGNWLVGGNNSVSSQECVSDWPTCTTLYRATGLNDTAPVTYLICDKSEGISRRSVFATTTTPTTSGTQNTLLSAGSAATSTSASITASSSASSSASKGSAAAATASPTSTLSPTPPAKIPGGTIAGVVVGVAIFLLVMGGIFVLWRRRKNTASPGLGLERKSELEDNSRPPVELTVDKDAKELPSDREPVELPGSPSLSVSASRPKTPGTVSSAEVPTPHDI